MTTFSRFDNATIPVIDKGEAAGHTTRRIKIPSLFFIALLIVCVLSIIMPTALSENDNQGTDDSSASSWSQNQNPTGDEKSIPDYSEVLIPVIGMAAIIATISFVPRIKKRDDEGERP